LPLPPRDEDRWKSSHFWHYFEQTAEKLATRFGFQEIRTPIFEVAELFGQHIGTETDIVSKEMYTFKDKAGRLLALRPEGTAPVMRAFIDNHLHHYRSLHKFFYISPMFRYERGQAGRYRQHHQFGVEAVGSSLPYQDAEVIHLLWTLYQELGLRNVQLYVNSIGTLDERLAFRAALLAYLRPHVPALSATSQDRYVTNPLRILDSKDPGDQEILEGAPHMIDFLEPPSATHFSQLCSLLTQVGISYQINHRLVRGLDYYNGAVFEVVSGNLGAQNSLGGGGRYDGLLKQMGGPDLPACGFGTGIERIIQALIGQEASLPPAPQIDLFLIPLGDQAADRCFALLGELRQKNYIVEMDLSGKKLKQAMKHAELSQARYVAVIGDNELERGEIELKEMDTGETTRCSLHRTAYALQKNS
jgi:histidyl-tRNA synthetase